MDSKSRKTPAKTLPDGWNWKDWDDGSGGLWGPKKEHYFSYDLFPYYSMGGIEYKESTDVMESWDIFWGNLSEFKKFAETMVRKKYL